MIAWKPSARRDRLITKEFENEVPVRCVLFLDTSDGVRLGPPGNTSLTRMAGVAAAVAQASAGNRDLVGLTTFDEAESQGDRAARTKPHMINVLQRLAEVSALQPVSKGVPPEHLTRRAYPLAHELYPELMNKRVNTMPLGRLWIPLLDRKYGWNALAIIAINGLLVGLFGDWRIWASRMRDRPHGEFSAAGSGSSSLRVWLLVLVLHVLAVDPHRAFWLIHGIRGMVRRAEEGNDETQTTLRALLPPAARPDGVERYLHDDAAYAFRVAAFLYTIRCAARCRSTTIRSLPLPLAGKSAVLAPAMVRAVGRARDNELFVVMADLAELGNDLAPS